MTKSERQVNKKTRQVNPCGNFWQVRNAYHANHVYNLRLRILQLQLKVTLHTANSNSCDAWKTQ